MTRRAILAFVVLAGLLTAAGCAITPDLSRETLEARYLAGPGDMRDIDGTPLHVRDTGPRDAQAVVMIHGVASSLHTWEPWARALEDEFRVIRFDLPGSGLSPPDPTGDYTDARTLALLAALMDDSGVEQAALIGNSLGGRIAWTFAATHPGRVTLDDATLTRYHDLLRAPGSRGALLERFRQTILVDPEPRLAGIEVPVLLLWGEEDGMIPVTNAADYERVLPNAALVRLPEIGHVPQEEAPDLSLVPVRDFLSAR
jgi:pimeloyl-ACP methyl ester carboxylesterase